MIGKVRAVGHQASVIWKLAKAIDGREAAAGSQGHEPVSVRKGEDVVEDDERLSIASSGSREHRLEVVGPAHLEWLKLHPQLPGCLLGLLPEDGTRKLCP